MPGIAMGTIQKVPGLPLTLRFASLGHGSVHRDVTTSKKLMSEDREAKAVLLASDLVVKSHVQAAPSGHSSHPVGLLAPARGILEII